MTGMDEEDASPSNQVIIIEKEFNGFGFDQRQQTQNLLAASMHDDFKSPSHDLGSTDVNQSLVISDHLTNKMVPMQLQEIQNSCDEPEPDKDKVRLQNMKCSNELYQKRIMRDVSLTRQEKER